MTSEPSDHITQVVPNGARRADIGTDNKRVAAWHKSPPGTVWAWRRTANKLADSLVESLRQRGTSRFAHLKAEFRLDKYEAAPVGDGADVIHLLASLTPDFLNLRRTDTPGIGKGRSRNEV
jgi:hypothetical protein